MHVCIFIYECILEVLCAIWGNKAAFLFHALSGQDYRRDKQSRPNSMASFSLVETYMQKIYCLSLHGIGDEMGALPEFCSINSET